MEEPKEDLMNIFEFLWFESSVLTTTANKKKTSNPSAVPTSSPPPVSNIVSSAPEASAAPEQVLQGPPRPLLRVPAPIRRSASVDAAFTSESTLLSRRRGNEQRKLHTILSGKEDVVVLGVGSPVDRVTDEIGEQRKLPAHSGRKQQQEKKRGKSRSMSDLEFEELKGFMDLGFTFSESEAADQRLLSIVPGLGRLQGKEKEVPAAVADVDEPAIPRPYLSEAWAVEAHRRKEREMTRKREEQRLLRNWKLPAAGDGVDLRDHLLLWAHTVASTVR